jgi:hypothetical protein
MVNIVTDRRRVLETFIYDNGHDKVNVSKTVLRISVESWKHQSHDNEHDNVNVGKQCLDRCRACVSAGHNGSIFT